ncbi:MAG: hypothetical protein QXM22_03155 [Candidatus Bathyarchaeia archaeon]
MVALKLKRRKVIIIQCFIEVAYFLSLIAYLMDGFYSGVTIDYILNTINTYKAKYSYGSCISSFQLVFG